MTSAYIIANVEVTNPVQYEDYKKWSTEAMKAHGAEVCARGGKVEVLEGDWAPQRIVILKFPSVEAAKKFNESPEYGKARTARQGAAIMRMIVVEGV
ncbi:uncharacterized protein (DUF1330 family) [Variovorax boronicumulans]|jgi:uncharacterized protein (DUF1330 family)|uniref:DUF1330 domain-containing protein n=1 Tax=Variovorax paradoxus (strain EPS) TaxID=595537 RepID=E6UUV9_VARPE|nr:MULTISPECIES: DUF1330 domain-containing protein [Variovorax]ADU36374.1 protein of unknown function DUF1330 [Variovorax paradoxus EPS]MDP9995320.1 uncharacterized protein (DUF1330 family) [Variovorax boronicumulans]MDQ0006610.1 uncharacterized protein (DUF1330 family) [Variovorax boronicumulans]MDQ0039833.1 uncharacterized protein (DUF1330 family) [Variovorax boronicumulans]MDQ0609399.1 uncharacterized protein (DUF1330 family) [Variovorax sp. W1I1]